MSTEHNDDCAVVAEPQWLSILRRDAASGVNPEHVSSDVLNAAVRHLDQAISLLRGEAIGHRHRMTLRNMEPWRRCGTCAFLAYITSSNAS